MHATCRKALPQRRRAPLEDEVVEMYILSFSHSLLSPLGRLLPRLVACSRRAPSLSRGCRMSSLHSCVLTSFYPFCAGALAPAFGRRPQAALGRRPTACTALLAKECRGLAPFASICFRSIRSSCPPRAAGVRAATGTTGNRRRRRRTPRTPQAGPAPRL